MSLNRHPPPYPTKLTIAVFGKRIQLKNGIGNTILGDSAFVSTTNDFEVETNDSFKIINTPDFFDEEYLNPDQLIIDFMALSHPGPDLFILAIDSENTQEEKVAAQITKLQKNFGNNVTAQLVVTLPDIESFHPLSSHLEQRFNTRLAIANENLANKCKEWCSAHRPFRYDYKHYSAEVVKTRMPAIETRYGGHPLNHHGNRGRAGTDHTSPSTSRHAFAAPASEAAPEHHIGTDRPSPSTSRHAFAAPASEAAPEHHIGDRADEVLDDTFNIVLLGLTGTGKSASANTILAAGSSQLDSKPLFRSEPSSIPVTTKCEVRTMEKLFGTKVRVVDTPDFFHDQFRDSEAQVEVCKRYCQPGRCVVLLVLQLGRHTVVEEGILEKLENKLGLKIRQSTILLLTHGEDKTESLEQYINESAHLKNIVDLCGQRYHLFNNKNPKNNKQVKDLIKKIPNSGTIFPKSPKGNNSCCVC